MSLTDSIDAALATANAQNAAPFRIDLTDTQIEILRENGRLEEPVGPKTLATGAYAGVNVFSTQRESEVLAQPEDIFKALHLVIR